MSEYANVNLNAANGSIHQPIVVNANVHVIELIMNFDVPSEIWSKKDFLNLHLHTAYHIPHTTYHIFGILAICCMWMGMLDDTVTWYTTQSPYPDTDLTCPCPRLPISSAKQVGDDTNFVIALFSLGKDWFYTLSHGKRTLYPLDHPRSIICWEETRRDGRKSWASAFRFGRSWDSNS